MGAAGSAMDRANAIPEHIDEGFCKSLLGETFDPKEFRSFSDKETGLIPRDKFIKAVLKRTDCFLTHDWGNAQDGYRNHALVSSVNRGLQDRGFTTWFDEEQMQGSIKKQMISGIDNSNCIVVFVTQRYIDKVGGDNAEDNCQLEFNYACRKRTGRRMVPVLMDKRAANPTDWDGEVGMVLGGTLYVDLTGDFDNDDWFNNQLDALANSILKVIGTPVQQLQALLRDIYGDMGGVEVVGGTQQVPQRATTTAPPPPSPSPLSTLSVEQVGDLMANLGLKEYRDVLMESHINGSILEMVEGVDDLKEMGISMAVKAKMLMKKLPALIEGGVPASLLKPTNSEAAVAVGSVTSSSSKRSNQVELEAVESARGAKDIPRLVQLLQISNFDEVKEAAATALNSVTDHRNRTRDANEKEAVKPLVDSLSNGTPKVKEEVAIALRNITRDTSVIDSAFATGVVEPMLELLRSGSNIGKANAAAAIWNFARSDFAADKFYAAGAVELLGNLLHGETMLMKEKAAGAIGNFAAFSHIQEKISNCGLMDSLLDCAYAADMTPSLKEQALHALQNLKHPDIIGMDDAHRKKDINALEKYLHNNHPFIREYAVVTLNEITDHRNKRNIKAERKLISPLITLLRTGSDLAKENAALTLRNITRSIDLVPICIHEGVMPPMVELLKHGAGKGKENAAAAIWNFARGNDINLDAIYNAGALPSLCELLKDGNLAERDKATGALINFCTVAPKYIPEIRATGAKSAAETLKGQAPKETKDRASQLIGYL